MQDVYQKTIFLFLTLIFIGAGCSDPRNKKAIEDHDETIENLEAQIDNLDTALDGAINENNQLENSITQYVNEAAKNAIQFQQYYDLCEEQMNENLDTASEIASSTCFSGDIECVQNVLNDLSSQNIIPGNVDEWVEGCIAGKMQ